MSTAKNRAAKLRAEINELRYRYHVLDDPAVDDAVYDSLTRELREIETAHPELITPDSPTQRVGGRPLAKFQSAAHQNAMLSLNDVFDQAELEAWVKRTAKLLPDDHQPEYHVDIKMDGLAASLIYENGSLVRGLTRGDGYVGEDVTHNLRTIESIPLSLRRDEQLDQRFYASHVEIRGEVVIYKADFKRVNAERRAAGLAEYANPRNLAAGSIRQLDPQLTAKRPLRFHAYSLQADPPLETLHREYETARQLGFIVNSQHQLLGSVQEIMKFAREWETKRQELPFQSDGLVVMINDRQQFQALGVVGKAPRAAVAYKYPAEKATTTVKDIFISIGRTGAATPVAMLEPVVVAGSLVQMATLHNAGEVARKDVRVGDTVVIRKAGDIIPEVVESLPKLRDGSQQPFKMLIKCPECGTGLVKLKADEAVWRCPNNNCPSRVQKRIEHFASKSALDIEGLGEKNVAALLSAKLINDPADLYQLKKEQLLELERFADISAGKLVASIAAKKRPELARFIYALGIRHVGTQTAIDLAGNFQTLENLQEAAVSADGADKLEQVEGIGVVVAESITAWFSMPANEELLDKFAKLGVQPPTAEKKTSTGKLNGQSFVITGTLEAMSRDEAADRIRALGGKTTASVTSQTNYLVVGKNPGSNKLEQATKYKTQQLNEQQLLDII